MRIHAEAFFSFVSFDILPRFCFWTVLLLLFVENMILSMVRHKYLDLSNQNMDAVKCARASTVYNSFLELV